MDLGLQGKRAIVTGGSRGIGAATAAVLRAEGAEVAVIGRDRAALDAVVAEHGVHAVVGDLASADGVTGAVDACIAALGGVDILVNNAGASPGGSLDVVTDEQWQETFDLKFMGYVRCTRAVLPAMRAQHYGRIVNVGGTGLLRAQSGYALASLAAGLVHFTRATAELVGPDGITVTMVHPGPTLTERLQSMLAGGAARAGTDVDTFARDVVGKGLPLGRVGTPEEVAATIALLCAAPTEWITGGGLTIDGGAAQGVVGG
ncbi:MAG: SDR family oxidoreductase [Acidimicrobiia bacterium]